METKIVKVDPFGRDESLLIPCAEVLRRGGLVAFPTETVYGLGANALMPEAVSRIFEAKGRPQDNPLIVHVSRPEAVAPLVRDISKAAILVMEAFWPGPLTLLFARSDLVPPVVTAGLPTVAIRMPDHPVAQRLIDLAGVPVAAPSANLSGKPSPTTFEDTLKDLKGRVDIIVDGGPSGIGVESTVLDISGPVPKILRPGGLSLEDLRSVLGEVEVASGIPSQGPPPSPGMKYRHYAPKAPVFLVIGSPEEQAEALRLHAAKHLLAGKRVLILSSSENLPAYAALKENWPESLTVLELGPREDLARVASRLFSGLRHGDETGADVILSESFPEKGLGLAIQNRLERASGGRTIKPIAEPPHKSPARPEMNVLLVCTGNTCRSPMAEVLLREIGKAECPEIGLNVMSRGTAAAGGMPATQEAMRAVAERGLDLSEHKSRMVSEKDLSWADLVITMTKAHKRTLVERYPSYSGKVATLSEASGGAVGGDVSDPFGLGDPAYLRARDELEVGLRAVCERIRRVTSNRDGGKQDEDRSGK
ncbi:MAG: L-threonylcarbamoyladenylate synthase [Bacillota bacterium]|jgi:L-threonylcarbamoyladenylate synthase